MSDDLRTLAKAVVDAWEARHQGRERPTDVEDAYAIIAALNAADAQGYARAMGEVDGLLQQRVQAHRDAMLDRMPQYANDIRQGAREEATEIREWLHRRLPAAAERD